MSYDEKKTQLQGWLEGVISYGVEPLRRLQFSEHGDGDGRGKVIFCTETHTYAIAFTDTYLGCIASSRKQRPGENWTRGSDLPDGEFSREVFDRIIQAIVAYELVDLDPVVEPVAVPAEVGPAL